MKTREERATRIIAHPGEFKVCHGCDAVVEARHNLCPNCHSYRFELSHDGVVAAVEAIRNTWNRSPKIQQDTQPKL